MGRSRVTPATRVVVLDHTAREGGAELALLRLAVKLRASTDLDLRVLLFANGPLVARLRGAGVPTAVLPLDSEVASVSRHGRLGSARAILAAVRFVPRLAAALRRAHPDLVVANSLKAAVFAALAAPLAGVRWVWHLHDRLSDDYLPAPVATLMRGLSAVAPRRVVVNSHATLETLPPRVRRTAVVAYPGLDESVLTATPVPAVPPLIGIIGRVSPTKGQREFLEAAALVARRRPDARFIVIGGALFGEDDYEAGLADLVRTAQLEDRVEFTGWVDDPLARLASLTAVVHASPVPEPFGQVVAEAVAVGVPVIATAAGGVPEILSTPDGGVGTLVPPGDVDALATAIDEVLDDVDAAFARAALGRRSAQRFDIRATAAVVRDAWLSTLRRSFR